MARATIAAIDGGPVTLAETKHRVLKAAGATSDPGLLGLRAGLEFACGCAIAELAQIAGVWP